MSALAISSATHNNGRKALDNGRKALDNGSKAPLGTSRDALHCGLPHEGRNGIHSPGSNDIPHADQHVGPRASRGREGRNRRRSLHHHEPAQSQRRQ